MVSVSSKPSARRCLSCVTDECLRRGHGRHGRSLGLGCSGGSALFLLEGVLAAAQGGDHAVTELLVQADVDARVVDSRGLGKEGWHCHEERTKFASLIAEDIPGHAGIGGPADQEADDHDDDHAGDLALGPLGGLRLLLLGSGFFDGADQAAVAEEYDDEWNHEVHDEHVDDEGLIVNTRYASVIVDSAGALHALGDVTGPAHQGWHGAGAGHDPGEDDTHDGVVLSEAEVAHGLTHDHPPLEGQHHQGPKAHFTTQGSEEAFHVAADASENEVAVQRGVHRRGEATEHHEEVGNGEVQQNVVERCTQLLVLDGDVQSEEIDGEAGEDEEEHVRGQASVCPWRHQVVLGILVRAPNNAGGVGHRHVECRSLCTVHGCGWMLCSAPF